jgi:hypothetical protein
VLLQLPALPQVPGVHGVVQAPSPQFCANVGDVYAAGPIRVALELPDQGLITKLLINKDNYMTGTTTYLSIITLNVNGLNSPIKRH